MIGSHSFQRISNSIFHSLEGSNRGIIEELNNLTGILIVV